MKTFQIIVSLFVLAVAFINAQDEQAQDIQFQLAGKEPEDTVWYQNERYLSPKSTKSPTMKSTKSPTMKSTKSPTMKSTKSPTMKSTKSPTMKSTKSPTLKSRRELV
eukprot:CAMPEP_0117039584 /NCGR_PEP_ID=MMETSP0472-20121206/27773_1 /TAXON_ID=693140 ORGANISM="Tiarina fusus, Strain LIS" /NCGR_SAMPLE_ID=MMETSP0472 /ASSEMBLY_ACC=CAM_ASM_000603 /LENGTH=106 /DNA_ID=CAMNT_0004750117 /DNA_START=69 /DNA_END=389 /DNA_ORIENTATION=-